MADWDTWVIWIIIIGMIIWVGGCARTVQTQCSKIPAEELPNVVSKYQGQDKSKYPNTYWVDGPIKIKPDTKGEGLYWRAPKEGAIVWKYPEWEAFYKSYKNHINWSVAHKKFIENHNKAIEGKLNADKAWYHVW
jgi:hypothetical protein